MKLLPDKFPVLPTQRLQLIEIKHTHQPDLFYLLTDKRVTAYFPVVPLGEVAEVRKVVDLFRQRFKDKQGIRWGIALKGSQELIGMIGFNNIIPEHKATMVYALVQEYWGKGFISEALTAVVDFGFNDLGLVRVDAEVLPGNQASQKVLEKNGFLHEGLLQQWMWWDGKAFDIHMYARSRKGWESGLVPEIA
ncbi:GNAT family N-acetyltransferase [Chitinophaga sp. 30R24]|uniref:GNAT family N-acetyltransferase n=1 Tax=Chitinophaga sp. 30R24 TaxID=3248838 RepID=UPI003B8FF4D5